MVILILYGVYLKPDFIRMADIVGIEPQGGSVVEGEKAKRTCLSNGDKILRGRYEILKCIHSKGMANVYIVQDSNLGKQWCLKEIRKSEAGKKGIEYVSLLQEANILRSLNYERIPRITAIEDENDSLFVIMDFLDGVTLKAFVEEKGRVPEQMAVKWMLQITQIMGYLHSEKPNKKPIFYRDMKPDNIMVRPNGAINLFDFGISVRLERKDQPPDYTLGTPGYVAPEQRKKKLPMDLRSDIYSMGRTFYFMLTGVDPRDFINIPLKPISDWSPDVSPALINIVEKCMAENPNNRFQNCEELQYALENYIYSDEKYRSTAKKKVRTVLTLSILGAVISVFSIIPFGMNNLQDKERYEQALLVAQQSGRFEDYDKAISLNPTKLSPYDGYFEIIENDGVFTKEEEVKLLNHINPYLSEIKTDPEYGRVAFEIGRLYWFFYEGDVNERQILSIKWFEDAIDAEFNTEEAKTYYNIGVFTRDISKSVQEANDKGMYIAYWNNLKSIQGSSASDIVTIQTNISIAKCISTYAYNLKKDGVSYEDVKGEVSSLNSFIRNYNVDTSIPTIKNLIDELKNLLKNLESRVDVVYGEGN